MASRRWRTRPPTARAHRAGVSLPRLTAMPSAENVCAVNSNRVLATHSFIALGAFSTATRPDSTTRRIMKRTLGTIAVLVVTGIPALAHAQAPVATTPITVALMGGAAMPMGDLDDIGGT